jgi:hypothetical protein
MSDRKRLKRLALALVTLTMVGGWAGPAFAVDGVILIDQPRAMAGSVTPGDAPGFPVTLSVPGSYRLSGNLTVLTPTDGIVITADRVTLDLNGFSVIGSGTGKGISNGLAGRIGTSIRNGTITNFQDGISLKESGTELATSEIIQVRAIGNAGSGILASAHSVVTGNTAVGNGLFGIHTGPASNVSDNNASRNETGLRVEVDTLVSRNTATRNRFAGMVVTCPSVFIGNALTGLVVLEIGCTFDPLP